MLFERGGRRAEALDRRIGLSIPADRLDLGMTEHRQNEMPFGERPVATVGCNPGKASDGKRLHRLEPDPITAPIVRRIFTEFIRGKGPHAVADMFTLEGIPSPSAPTHVRLGRRTAPPHPMSSLEATCPQNGANTGSRAWPSRPELSRSRLFWSASMRSPHSALVKPADASRCQVPLSTAGRGLAFWFSALRIIT